MADYSGENITLTIDSPGLFNSNSFGRNFLIGSVGVPLLRALVGGEFVYFTGEVPIGATDVVVVSPAAD